MSVPPPALASSNMSSQWRLVLLLKRALEVCSDDRCWGCACDRGLELEGDVDFEAEVHLEGEVAVEVEGHIPLEPLPLALPFKVELEFELELQVESE